MPIHRPCAPITRSRLRRWQSAGSSLGGRWVAKLMARRLAAHGSGRKPGKHLRNRRLSKPEPRKTRMDAKSPEFRKGGWQGLAMTSRPWLFAAKAPPRPLPLPVLSATSAPPRFDLFAPPPARSAPGFSWPAAGFQACLSHCRRLHPGKALRSHVPHPRS